MLQRYGVVVPTERPIPTDAASPRRDRRQLTEQKSENDQIHCGGVGLHRAVDDPPGEQNDQTDDAEQRRTHPDGLDAQHRRPVRGQQTPRSGKEEWDQVSEEQDNDPQMKRDGPPRDPLRLEKLGGERRHGEPLAPVAPDDADDEQKNRGVGKSDQNQSFDRCHDSLSSTAAARQR